MLFMIDNYDSFTYNLFQYFRMLGAEVEVVRNDCVSIGDIERLGPSAIVISPGPCRPEDAGVCIDAIREFSGKVPILGICLGHQAIAAAFGGEVVHAKRLMHGKVSSVTTDGRSIYTGISNPFDAMRYHSLAVDQKSLPECLEATAFSEDGEVMGIRHRQHLTEGVQFHPESIMTTVGKRLLKNFLTLAGRASRRGGKKAMIRESLKRLTGKVDLSEEEMAGLVGEIMSGNATDAQIGAVMAALATKGETFSELAGAARAMRRKAVRIQTNADVVVDTCGTGGDMSNTFNISTTAAFVVAGCGVTVAKHGNRSVSSKCGSADLLEALGVNLDAGPEIVEEAIRQIGIGFLFAPMFHGAMRHASKARRELGVRSIFNMLGPLTNPAGANCQLIGVYAPELTEMFARALERLGAKRAWVVHGHDGLDEISVCAPTRVSELNDGIIRTYDIDPERFLGRRAEPRDLAGGTPAENAGITMKILSGENGPRRDVVLVNAGAALVVAGVARDLDAGLKMAATSISEGRAMEKLEALVRVTSTQDQL